MWRVLVWAMLGLTFLLGVDLGRSAGGAKPGKAESGDGVDGGQTTFRNWPKPPCPPCSDESDLSK